MTIVECRFASARIEVEMIAKALLWEAELWTLERRTMANGRWNAKRVAIRSDALDLSISFPFSKDRTPQSNNVVGPSKTANPTLLARTSSASSHLGKGMRVWSLSFTHGFFA